MISDVCGNKGDKIMRKSYKLDNVENKREFIANCIAQSYLVLRDELDCRKSWCRVPTEKTTVEILDLTDNKGNLVIWTFIVRDRSFMDETYIDAGLRVGSPEGVDYFLWVRINTEKLDYFVDKYNLETV